MPRSAMIMYITVSKSNVWSSSAAITNHHVKRHENVDANAEACHIIDNAE